MVRAWKLHDDHSTSESKDGVALQVGPVFCISYGCQECIGAVWVEKGGFDALGIIGGWNCRVVVPFGSQRLPYWVRWFAFPLNECLFQLPGELRVGFTQLFLAACLYCHCGTFNLWRYELVDLGIFDRFGSMLS